MCNLLLISKKNSFFKKTLLVTIGFITFQINILNAGILYELPMHAPDKDEEIGKYVLEEKTYRKLKENGYLPVRTTFMTDIEIAQKLDLNLPQLRDVKSALDKNDNMALQKALGTYISRRLTPLKVESPPKPVPSADHPEMENRPDSWLGTEIIHKHPIFGYKKYTIGERINWYNYEDLELPDGSVGFSAWGIWGYTLARAYLATGEPKYAKAILMYARSFYKNVRPPIQKPRRWIGGMGPWSGGGSGRMDGCIPYIYRAIADSPVTTDANRVMFLKMFYEHAEYIYLFTEDHVPHNWESGIVTTFLDLALTFPEFRESKKWIERCVTRYTQNIQDTVLKDGGSWERTLYHTSIMRSFTTGYYKMRDAGILIPKEFSQKLEKMHEWLMWILSPTWLYTGFGHGYLREGITQLYKGVEIFPKRSDFLYVASAGKGGQTPKDTAKDLFHSGFVVMRSDWLPSALYMSINYNGAPIGVDHHPELLSFALWANEKAYMTNAGTTAPYGAPNEVYWCEHTISSNTVLVDDENQKQVDNGGRLETWESHPGFDYLSAFSRGYEWLGVSHRRAIFFNKFYWLIYDWLDGGGKPHTYRWLGHFQPTELTVDSFTKIVSTKPKDGKRLYLIPGVSVYSHFGLEQSVGPINTENTQEGEPGPYISLAKSSANPVIFSTLLYPSTKDDDVPQFHPLSVKDGVYHNIQGELPYNWFHVPQSHPDAVGYVVRYGTNEDVIALSHIEGLRTYFNPIVSLITDGELAYVHQDKEKGKITKFGIVKGEMLRFGGGFGNEPLLKVSPNILAVSVQYEDDTVQITTHGNGKIQVARMSANKVILNGKEVTAKIKDEMMEIESGNLKPIVLTPPIFSTEPSILCRAIGIPYGPEMPPNSWGSWSNGPENSVVVMWNSSEPVDAEIEYRMIKEKDWKRTVHGEFTTEHSFVISNLEPGKKYEFRITCHSEDGGVGESKVTYTMKRRENL